MPEFTRSVDELIPKLSKQKVHILTHLKKNYSRNIHYIEKPSIHISDEVKQNKSGGHNRIDILLTEEAFVLVQNSYNLRNKQITELTVNGNLTGFILPIETQTIGFIENSYVDCVETIRQFIIGKYRVDLYFPKHKIIVECDEFGHVDRDPNYESTREKYLISQGNNMVRYNPNEPNFDLSNVLKHINKIIMST
jgi:very-short-patch-repair endonuclease